MLTSELKPSPARFWPSAEVTCESGISAEIFNLFLLRSRAQTRHMHPFLPPIKLRQLSWS